MVFWEYVAFWMGRDDGVSVKISVQSITTWVLGYFSLNWYGKCLCITVRDGKVISGRSCWLRKIIQVERMWDTLVMLILNRCARSCSRSPKRKHTSTIKNSSIESILRVRYRLWLWSIVQLAEQGFNKSKYAHQNNIWWQTGVKSDITITPCKPLQPKPFHL